MSQRSSVTALAIVLGDVARTRRRDRDESASAGIAVRFVDARDAFVSVAARPRSRCEAKKVHRRAPTRR
jgi:hypothetical protein